MRGTSPARAAGRALRRALANGPGGPGLDQPPLAHRPGSRRTSRVKVSFGTIGRQARRTRPLRARPGGLAKGAPRQQLGTVSAEPAELAARRSWNLRHTAASDALPPLRLARGSRPAKCAFPHTLVRCSAARSPSLPCRSAPTAVPPVPCRLQRPKLLHRRGAPRVARGGRAVAVSALDPMIDTWSRHGWNRSVKSANCRCL